MRTLVANLLSWWKFRNTKFASVGEGAKLRYLRSHFSSPENIHIGPDAQIGPGAHLDGAGGITIGRGVIFAPQVTLFSRTHNFRQDVQAIPFDDVVLTAPIQIKDYVWIGHGVIILPGVTIGRGAVIGAGAVVTKDVSDGTIAAGNPARPIGQRDMERFEQLAQDPGNFVYRKFGHKKRATPMRNA